MILYPNCKINIGLRVISKRADGYHNLETIFYPILGLYDVLMITASGQFSFVQDGLAVDCPAEDNLILKCYRRMQARYPQIGNVSIRFTKRIPFGAGLGGGSSDAAHTAIALNELFELGLSREQLAEEVAPLGADCAFFIYNTPCLAEGIGEILTPIPFTLSGFRLVMLKPDIHISTREAYQGVLAASHQPSLADLVKKEFTPIDLSRHADIVCNDFERTVFPAHPELAALKQRLIDAGVYYAAMSGSGSTIYALFEDDPEKSDKSVTPTDTTLAGYGLTDLAPLLIFNDILP
ncbi:MAG: 4-(cytidine 5'-diphospho)-2-C-methyl-D-erythritol kinase [Paludibacteraceae bacterium]|nr:4-(cytidine 5'-diphospho)-2-C-methyl-D-erythritol kinase [Paludibacteraceae bacterium]